MTHSLKQLKTLLSPASCMLVPFKFNSLNIKISHLGFNKCGVFRKYNDYRRLPFYVRPRTLVSRQEQQMTITCQISGNYIHKRLSSCNSSLIKWCTQLIMYPLDLLKSFDKRQVDYYCRHTAQMRCLVLYLTGSHYW